MAMLILVAQLQGSLWCRQPSDVSDIDRGYASFRSFEP
jgi:hypothetical protein